MAKFLGFIGYAETKETSPGVYEELEPVEKLYRGDIIRNVRKWEKSDNVNDDLNISNSISIVADSYAYNHIHCIRYVKWLGASWKVTNIEIQRPRLILTIGGVYNG